MTYPRGTTFTPFVSASAASALTSTAVDIRNYRALRSYVRWEGQVSGTFIKEATIRIPVDVLISVDRFPSRDWTTVESRVLSGSNSQSLFSNSNNELWSYTRHRWIPATSNTGSISSFTSAKH
jgi:hypothetical protein